MFSSSCKKKNQKTKNKNFLIRLVSGNNLEIWKNLNKTKEWENNNGV